MICSLGIYNLLEEILAFPILLFSSISLHWSLRTTFLSLLAILWNSAFRCLYLSFSPLLLASLLFTALCKLLSDNCFALSLFFFLGLVLAPVPFTMSHNSILCSYVVYNMLNASLEGEQAWINIAGRNINSLRRLDEINPMAKNEENVNNFFMKMKENEKFGLKFDIQTTKILISGPIPA